MNLDIMQEANIQVAKLVLYNTQTKKTRTQHADQENKDKGCKWKCNNYAKGELNPQKKHQL